MVCPIKIWPSRFPVEDGGFEEPPLCDDHTSQGARCGKSMRRQAFKVKSTYQTFQQNRFSR